MNTRLIIAAVVVIGMSGCASQGGGKLDHDEVMAAQSYNDETVEVCTQGGATIRCYTEGPEKVRIELERQMSLMNYGR